jgi:hypothetical protein
MKQIAKTGSRCTKYQRQDQCCVSEIILIFFGFESGFKTGFSLNFWIRIVYEKEIWTADNLNFAKS